jgi:hypothetical protein
MVVQSIPDNTSSDDNVPTVSNRILGNRIQSYLDCIGLWQRPWTLFAPDPRKDLAWLSADISAREGATSRWSSPLWSEASVYDKFFGFRHLNYYNRFRDPLIQSVSDDLADFLGAYESPYPVTGRVELSLSSIKTLPNEGIPFPSRDETMTMLVSKPLTVREATPSWNELGPSHKPVAPND